MSIEHRDAAVIVEQGLTAVFDAAVVRQLREDSPLAALGMTPADAVCVSDAIADEASRSGWVVDLGDVDLGGVDTVADLVHAVELRAVPEAGE